MVTIHAVHAVRKTNVAATNTVSVPRIPRLKLVNVTTIHTVVRDVAVYFTVPALVMLNVPQTAGVQAQKSAV